MVDFSRNIAFGHVPPDYQSFLDVMKLSEKHLLFTAATSTKISPKLYDYTITKGPVEFRLELDNVGKTSHCIKTLFFLEGLDAPAIENKTQMVIVDIDLRRPSQLPEWWREKYTPGVESDQGLRIPRNVVPDSGILSHSQVIISASNLDMYMHTNWTNYLKFCYEAFIDYEVKKHGKANIHSAFRKVKQFSLHFMHESSLMDILDVEFWKDPENTNLYKFQIHKQAEEVCEAQIEFYPYEDDEDSLSSGKE